MEEHLASTTAARVTRIIRNVMPWALGLVVFALSLFVPGVPPVKAMSSYVSSDVSHLMLGLGAALGGLTAALARRWCWPLVAVAAASWLLLTAFPAVAVASYYVAIRLSRLWHIIAYLVVAGAAILVPYLAAMGTGPIGVIFAVGIYGLTVCLPFAIGVAVKARRQVYAALEDRAARLEREQLAKAEQARVEERARIAREMHDVVAHRVALMVLHAGAVEVNAPNEQLASQASLIRTTGRAAMNELRQVLGVLRTGEVGELAPQPDLSDLDQLLAQTRAAGVNVSYTQAGEESHCHWSSSGRLTAWSRKH